MVQNIENEKQFLVDKNLTKNYQLSSVGDSSIGLLLNNLTNITIGDTLRIYNTTKSIPIYNESEISMINTNDVIPSEYDIRINGNESVNIIPTNRILDNIYELQEDSIVEN